LGSRTGAGEDRLLSRITGSTISPQGMHFHQKKIFAIIINFFIDHHCTTSMTSHIDRLGFRKANCVLHNKAQGSLLLSALAHKENVAPIHRLQAVSSFQYILMIHGTACVESSSFLARKPRRCLYVLSFLYPPFSLSWTTRRIHPLF
jgi:hypothetical protein